MLKRPSPRREAGSASPDTVHIHGPEDGSRNRIVSWPLGRGDAEVESAASLVIAAALANVEPPILLHPEVVDGVVRVDLWSDIERARHIARTGLNALRAAQDSGILDSNGVSLSTMVVSFPDSRA